MTHISGTIIGFVLGIWLAGLALAALIRDARQRRVCFGAASLTPAALALLAGIWLFQQTAAYDAFHAGEGLICGTTLLMLSLVMGTAAFEWFRRPGIDSELVASDGRMAVCPECAHEFEVGAGSTWVVVGCPECEEEVRVPPADGSTVADSEE